MQAAIACGPASPGSRRSRVFAAKSGRLSSAKRRVELDKEYIDRWSLWLDICILIATVRAVFFDRDAY